MSRSKKIDLANVLACLVTVCPNFGKTITPAEVQRIDFELMKSPPAARRSSRASAERTHLSVV